MGVFEPRTIFTVTLKIQVMGGLWAVLRDPVGAGPAMGAERVSHFTFRIFGGTVSTEQARFENTHGKLCAEGLNG